jgi:hypothetical protein
LFRARQIDGSVIQFCEGLCRNEFGYAVFPGAAPGHRLAGVTGISFSAHSDQIRKVEAA